VYGIKQCMWRHFVDVAHDREQIFSFSVSEFTCVWVQVQVHDCVSLCLHFVTALLFIRILYLLLLRPHNK